MDSPLLQVLRPALAGATWAPGRWPTLDECQALLDGLPQPPRTAAGMRLRVVPQAAAAGDWTAAYEPRIHLSGELQTRSENWHDWFNLLVWASFPRAKAALNRRHFDLQQARAASHATRAPRNPVQDALTQFDESGVVVACADPALADLLQHFQWKELFWHRRVDVQAGMVCYLFGHGLMEKALTPYRGMTGKGIVLAVEPGFFSLPLAGRIAWLDAALPGRIDALQRPSDLSPVPVLGFPGFTPENEAEAYYDDEAYFRPGRRLAAK